MSKRIHEEEENLATKRPRQVDSQWGDLCGDLLRELVCAVPSLLPALYLVCKMYKALFDNDPNGRHWQLYFNSVPGYSDYSPLFCLPPRTFDDWRSLVRGREHLAPRYYLKLQHPVWPCGLPVPISVLQAIFLPCKCGVQHSPRDPITTWTDVTIELKELPFLAVRDQSLQVCNPNDHVGCTWTMSGPSWFVYDGATETILRKTQRSPFHGEPSSVLTAARIADIPEGKKWQVARFVGFA